MVKFVWILRFTGIAAAGLLAATVWLGYPPRIVVLLGKPKALILAAVLCWFTAGLLSIRPWQDRRRALVFLGRRFFLAVSLLISLAVAEPVLRQTMQQRQTRGNLWDLTDTREGVFEFEGDFTPLLAIIRRSANARLVYDLQPNLDMTFGHRRLRTNAEGHRDDREYDIPKPEGVVRIVGIGDSGMFGWGVEQGEDYMRRLEAHLNRNTAHRFEVINLAVPGYNTQQELDMLRDRGLKYEPDIVILGWCDNDFDAPFLLDKPWNADGGQRSLLYSLLFYRTETLMPRIMRAAELEAADIDPEILTYSGTEGVTRTLDELSQLSRLHGFQLLVFGAMNQTIVDICQTLAIPYFNTRTRIPEDRYPADYAIHFMHPRAEGHNLLAGYLKQELHDRDWLP